MELICRWTEEDYHVCKKYQMSLLKFTLPKEFVLPALKCGMVLIITTFNGCKPGNATLIIHQWRPIAVSMPISDSLKSDLFSKTIIEFTETGKCYINGPQMHDTANYVLSDNGKTLTVTGGAKSQNIEMSIDTLTTEKFVFTTKVDGNSTTAVPVK